MLRSDGPEFRNDLEHLDLHHSTGEFVNPLITGLQADSLPYVLDQLSVDLWLMLVHGLEQRRSWYNVSVERREGRNFEVAYR